MKAEDNSSLDNSHSPHGENSPQDEAQQLAVSNITPVTSMISKPISELKGFGGWLILPMLGIILSVFVLPVAIYTQNIEVIEYWDKLTDPRSNLFIPLLKQLIYFEILGNCILYLVLLFLCYVFFTKKNLTIKVYIFFQLFSLALIVADIVLAVTFLDLEVDAEDIKDIFRSLVSCVIWIPYFLVSRRVKNTFIN